MKGVDRRFSLDDLIGSSSRAGLRTRIDCLVGGPTALATTAGDLLWGTVPEGASFRVPVTLELEAAGHLVSSVGDLPRLQAAAGLLGFLMRQRAQYLMAADLHVEAVQSDYETLLAKHAALEASEQRLRELSAELEQRVKDQVRLLDERQRQLYEAEKLASVGQLAAGVAHEINNPIGFIRSNLATSRRYVAQLAALREAARGASATAFEVAASEIDLDFVLDDFDDLLRDCIDGADRIARIVRDLKGFSNVDGADEGLLDLNESLILVCDMLAAKLPAGVSLHRALQPLPKWRGRPGPLNQVFFNLLRNAAQAVGDHGTISVASGVSEQGIRIEIRDDGCGIPAEHLKRVFDPFFTTRRVGEGTGLGLTVVRDAVHSHGGRVELDSRSGSGTRVSVILPVEVR
jgi:signal transduction histidine kinase